MSHHYQSIQNDPRVQQAKALLLQVIDEQQSKVNSPLEADPKLSDSYTENLESLKS